MRPPNTPTSVPPDAAPARAPVPPPCTPVPTGGVANGAQAPQQRGFASTAVAGCVQGRKG